ncbi:MAG: O-antigen ligase family protein [Defluviitaleaceae bacterium]|nr:O-antigen ligase family protein [Defluviitaleaceae bacterium]
MNSVVLRNFLKILYGLDYWYENSLTHKFAKSLLNIAKNSAIFRFIAKENVGEYSSFVLGIPLKLTEKLIAVTKKFFLYLAALNNASINKKIFVGFVSFMSAIPHSFLAKVALGSIPGRFLCWLLDISPQIKYHKHANTALLTFFFAIAALSFLFPFHIVLVAFLGLGFVVLTFANISLSFALFVMGMVLVPHHLWSNMFILGAAVFFWGVFAIQYFLGKNNGVDKRYISASLLLYVFFCIVSLFTGFGGMDSVRVATILFSAIALGILAINIIDTKAKLQNIAVLIFGSVVITSLYGLWLFHMGIEIRADFVDILANVGLPGRLHSTIINPNNYAKFLTMMLPICAAYAFTAKGNLRKFIFAMLLVPAIAALALTFSRISYLAIFGIVGTCVLLIKPRLIPVGIALAILSIPFVPDVILMRLSTIGTDSSSLYRLWIWEGSWRTVQNYWSQGIGIGPQAFTLIYRAHAHEMAGNAMHAHNVLLNVWIEVGIGGLIAVAIYNLSTLKHGIHTFLRDNTPHRYYLVALVSALVGFLMFSVVEHVWFYPRTMLTYFIITGLLWSCVRMASLQNPKKEQKQA